MISYAQNQEDVILARVFAGQPRGTYVDVGAHFPVIDSVTEHFYRLGWRGLNIDPLPAAYAELCQVRVHDINLNIAVAETDGEAMLFALDGYSTLMDDVAGAHRKAGLVPGAIATRTRPLAAVLAENGVERIDFLKVDVEGAELAVLASNDWDRFRPSLVLVEAVDPVTRAPNHAAWEPVLLEAGYGCMHFDGVNRFYWNNRDLAPAEAAWFLPPNAFDGFTLYAVIAAEGRAAGASREAAYERQRIGNLLTSLQAGLEQLARNEAVPAPDGSLEPAWMALGTALREAQGLRQAARRAIAALGDASADHGDLVKALDDAALAAQAALRALASDRQAANAAARATLAQAEDSARTHAAENETLRRMLALSEQRRLALIDGDAVGATPLPDLATGTPEAHPAAPLRIPVALDAANVAADARVFARREDLLASFAALRPSTVAEIGVAFGDFSQHMIEVLRPSRFVAFDVFSMHHFPSHWGRSSAEVFGALTHREFFEKRMAGLGGDFELVVVEGESGKTLPHHPDAAFDLVYIDGAHDYEGVRMDAFQASRLASPTGILIFNDYILYDHMLSAAYGVVQAVNELLAGGEWVVAGFALQQHMFCDIALRRASAPLPPTDGGPGSQAETGQAEAG